MPPKAPPIAPSTVIASLPRPAPTWWPSTPPTTPPATAPTPLPSPSLRLVRMLTTSPHSLQTGVGASAGAGAADVNGPPGAGASALALAPGRPLCVTTNGTAAIRQTAPMAIARGYILRRRSAADPAPSALDGLGGALIRILLLHNGIHIRHASTRKCITHAS
ncbi:exported hypothetical protein [Burkholderiales bacterium]|nr:exported hypothetical protein [Burkholderiales bacterium]